jgi:hypothetical protein
MQRVPPEPQWDKHSIHETKSAAQWISPDIFTQSGVQADRFARKLTGFLKSSHSARSRRLTPGRWAALINAILISQTLDTLPTS